MTISARPVFDAIVRAGIAITGAYDGWLLACRGDELVVVTTAGGDTSAASRLGATFDACAGSAGLAAACRQPVARRLASGDRSEHGAAADQLASGARAILSVPCADEEVRGVLELVDKQGGHTFSIDDIELAMVLGSVAAAALAEVVPSTAPSEVAGALLRLEAAHDSAADALATLRAAVAAR